jgi:hypothetical protein
VKKQKRDSSPSQEKPPTVERKSMIVKSKYNSNMGNPSRFDSDAEGQDNGSMSSKKINKKKP